MDFFKKDCKDIDEYENKGDFEVVGKLNGKITSNKLMFLAANPPNHLTNYSGSGFPFPNFEIAFENTPNKGVVEINNDGSFKFKIHYPNSYYNDLGTSLITPQVFIKLCNSEKINTIKLQKFIPNRYLDSKYKYKYNYNLNKKQINENMEILTQEQLLRKNGI